MMSKNICWLCDNEALPDDVYCAECLERYPEFIQQAAIDLLPPNLPQYGNLDDDDGTIRWKTVCPKCNEGALQASIPGYICDVCSAEFDNDLNYIAPSAEALT